MRLSDNHEPWASRITIRPTVKEAVKALAKEECRSVAVTIGMLLEKACAERLTAGSSV